MTAGYPKLSYRRLGDRLYEVAVQAAPRSRPAPVGRVSRHGSLPSMQGWQAEGYWPGAGRTRTRSSRGDAGADLWSAWTRWQGDHPALEPCGCLSNDADAHRVGCPRFPEGKR